MQTFPCSLRAPNLLHVLSIQMVGWKELCNSAEALIETVFSRNFVTLGADFESQNLKHDLARLCFMLYTLSQWKFWENLKTLENFKNFGF